MMEMRILAVSDSHGNNRPIMKAIDMLKPDAVFFLGDGIKQVELLDDMYETMQKSEGVGLAAPQVGILKRAVVVDTGNGKIELINPVITEESGSQIGSEGCLSVPKVFGEVERPMKVKVHAQDRDGNWFDVEGEELTARAFCHEIEHLDGKLFLDRVIRYLD